MGTFINLMIDTSDAALQRPDLDCRPAVFFSAAAGHDPFFAPYCTCGWFGAATASRKRAFREARRHASVVDPRVHGLEAKGVPPALRAAAEHAALPGATRGPEAEGLIRVINRSPHSFRRVKPPPRYVPTPAGGTMALEHAEHPLDTPG